MRQQIADAIDVRAPDIDALSVDRLAEWRARVFDGGRGDALKETVADWYRRARSASGHLHSYGRRIMIALVLAFVGSLFAHVAWLRSTTFLLTTDWVEQSGQGRRLTGAYVPPDNEAQHGSPRKRAVTAAADADEGAATPKCSAEVVAAA